MRENMDFTKALTHLKINNIAGNGLSTSNFSSQEKLISVMYFGATPTQKTVK